MPPTVVIHVLRMEALLDRPHMTTTVLLKPPTLIVVYSSGWNVAAAVPGIRQFSVTALSVRATAFQAQNSCMHMLEHPINLCRQKWTIVTYKKTSRGMGS
jgi:hypothetical protein